MRKQSHHPPSQEFQLSFIHSGSIVVNCDFCGRMHFCDREDVGWEPGELEQYREERRKDPGQVMGWDCTSIGRGTLDGVEFADCCPCQEIRRYEDFIWEHRHDILRYLKQRSTLDIRRARDEADRLAVAQAIMDEDHVLYLLEDAIEKAKNLPCNSSPGDHCIPAPTHKGRPGEIQWCDGLDSHGWISNPGTYTWNHATFERSA